ncbi:MAG: DUF3488 and transglutaminase-like domain-containing protein, partial [Thermoanaerobaculia bacterium]|nr:DUF3488 and transglutaminase-like domain-containing protein [Thermoanaerobaculia bacterium]
PFFFGDLTLFWRGQVLQPLAHLALFTLTVKLFALKREQDKWHAMLAIFFLFLASMGSSVHPSVVVYQVVILGLSIWTLTRFAGYHEAARAEAEARSRPPLGSFAVGATALTVVVAIPLFVLLPRLRQPYLVAPGVAGGGGQATGFSERVTLDTIGRVRTSSAVAFRFSFEGPPPDLPELRFRMAVFETFDGNAWYQEAAGNRLMRRAVGGFFELGPGRPRSWMQVWMRPTPLARLPLPQQTIWLDVPAPAVLVDSTGAVSLLAQPTSAVAYRAGLARRPPLAWSVFEEPPPSLAERNVTEASPRLARLAAEVAGAAAGPAETAERIEHHLIREYGYSLELLPGREDRPIDRFLFETRQGHCEYFASAMVLMLRTQGVPARLVTGYWGAEFNPLQEYFIVRQSNAHAWVEAYLPDEGWRVFDPTPAAGLPAAGDVDWRRLALQAYDYLLFRWDRYVLTYGFSDQAGVFLRLRGLWQSLWERLAGGDEESAGAAAEAQTESAETTSAPPERREAPVWRQARWAPLLALLAALVIWLRRRRASWTAVDAYRQLRQALARRRAGVDEATAPLELERRLVSRCPTAEEPAGRIVRLYLEESFAGRPPRAEERARLREDLKIVRRALRKTA